MEEKIAIIQNEYLEKIKAAATLPELDEIYLKLFGKEGAITLLPKGFASLAKEELQKVGPLFNSTKKNLEAVMETRRQEVREEGYQKLTEDPFDPKQITEIKARQGHVHPVLQYEKEIAELFGKLGFQQIDASHIDSDYNNFEVLNIPDEHPARDLWDTLYIHPESAGINPGKILLRTHTSNAQIKIMTENKPPIRMMNIGRAFRYENLDARHEHTFEQFELVYIDKGLSMANLQYLSEYFLKAVFGPETKVRLRPKYYPFVEPGVGVDGECIGCQGSGQQADQACKICGGTGWLELAGAGMIHPNVLKNGGIDPEEYSGIAWGFGPERMAMIKYDVKDIRLFNSADLKFLERF